MIFGYQCSGLSNCAGRHFLAYFFVAADKEVSRQQAKHHVKKE